MMKIFLMMKDRRHYMVVKGMECYKPKELNWGNLND